LQRATCSLLMSSVKAGGISLTPQLSVGVSSLRIGALFLPLKKLRGRNFLEAPRALAAAQKALISSPLGFKDSLTLISLLTIATRGTSSVRFSTTTWPGGPANAGNAFFASYQQSLRRGHQSEAPKDEGRSQSAWFGQRHNSSPCHTTFVLRL